MALFTQNPVTLVPSDQQSAGSVKPQATDLSASSRNVQDTAAQRLFTQTGAALLSVQQQLDQILGVMRSPIPQPENIVITDPNGNMIAWIGYQAVGNVIYEGAWFKEIFIGGTDAAHAVISSDINGNVTIDGAEIILVGPGGSIVLDPSVPDIVLTGPGGSITLDASVPTFLEKTAANLLQVRIENGVIIAQMGSAFASTPFPEVNINALGGVTLINKNGVTVGAYDFINSNLDAQLLIRDNSTANSVTITGTTGNIDATGSIHATDNIQAGLIVTAGTQIVAGTSVTSGTFVNAITGFEFNGTPGVTTNVAAGTSLTVNTSATGVFGTPGVGQSNGTVVTGVTLNLTVHQVLGGILTT